MRNQGLKKNIKVHGIISTLYTIDRKLSGTNNDKRLISVIHLLLITEFPKHTKPLTNTK